MAVTIVWDTWLKPGTETEGLRLTRQVWSDMRSFEGYLWHRILIDQDAPGHVIALANWRSREDAARVLGEIQGIRDDQPTHSVAGSSSGTLGNVRR
jgi:hypothetical protein